MANEKTGREKRKADPYLDRRSGEDRRAIYLIDYFSAGGMERREMKERRNPKERRRDCVKVSRWSSVCQDTSPAVYGE
jgi:hypothetical protein